MISAGARKPFFFGVWSLLFGPYILTLPIITLARSFVTQVSVSQVVSITFVVFNGGFVEFYLLFRFAQAVQSSPFCMRMISRCRWWRASTETPSNGDGIGNGNRNGNRSQTSFTRFLARAERRIHDTRPGQIVVLFLSISNLLIFSAIFFAMFVQAPMGSLASSPKPFGSVFLQSLIRYWLLLLNIFGTATFVPYLAFRAVMAIGYLTKPYHTRSGTEPDVEGGALLNDEEEKP